MCKKGKYNTFLHQAALAGAALKLLERKEMILLSQAYNYPVFFDRFYDAELTFDSIEKVITLPYEFSFQNLPGAEKFAYPLKYVP